MTNTILVQQDMTRQNKTAQNSTKPRQFRIYWTVLETYKTQLNMLIFWSCLSTSEWYRSSGVDAVRFSFIVLKQLKISRHIYLIRP